MQVKEEHDEEAEQSQNMAKLTKCLGRAKEALKKTTSKRDDDLRAKEELGEAVAKKDVDVKKVRMELIKA